MLTWSRLLAIVVIICTTRPVAADSPPARAAVRLSAAAGSLEELTWAAPGVDLVGALALGADRRAELSLQLGYSPIDSHTFLSDGLVARIAVAGGVVFPRAGALGVRGGVGIEYIAFHADPDVLVEHPDVDLVVRREAIVPTGQVEVSYPVHRQMAVGAFARAGFTRIELFREGDADPSASGGRTGRARLVLAGLFFQFRLR